MGRTFPRIVTSRGTIRAFGGEWRDETSYPGQLLDRAGDLVFVYLDAPGAVPLLISTTHRDPEDQTNLICRLARYERPVKEAEIQKALVAAGEAAVVLYQANAALRETKETPMDALRERHGDGADAFLVKLTQQREMAGLNARRAVERVLWLRTEGQYDAGNPTPQQSSEQSS